VRSGSRARRDLEKQELRDRILREAAALFVSSGEADFSIRQVAERIGYTPTTIYRYFADKDALLFAVCDQGFDRFEELLGEADESASDPFGRIEAMGRAYFAFALQFPDHYQVMFVLRGDYLMAPPHKDDPPRIASLLLLRRAVEDAMTAGQIRSGDVVEMANSIWAAVHGAALLAMSPMVEPERRDSLLAAVLEMISNGIRKDR
jgi:AcrR family transcriptional regulator